MEEATSLGDIQKNIDAAQAVVTAAEKNIINPGILSDMNKHYASQAGIVFVQNMISFLQDNQLFWNNVSASLLEMNKMSLELNTKIYKK